MQEAGWPLWVLKQEAESEQEVGLFKFQGPPPGPTSSSRIPSPKESTVFPNKAACWDQMFKHRSLWEAFHIQAITSGEESIVLQKAAALPESF